MLIAISAENDQDLDSVVSAHFGRCPFFVLVEVEDEEIRSARSVANPFYGHHQPGQVPSFIHELGATVMLTGGMGQRAIQFFRNFGIEAATGAHGTVRHALKLFFKAELKEAEPCAESQKHSHDDHDHESDDGYEKDEVGRLVEEAGSLKAELDEVLNRINRLQKDE